MMIVVSDEFEARFKAIARNVLRAPFTEGPGQSSASF